MTTAYDIAAYIAQYANDPQVKAELKKLGFGIVPNSFSQLVAGIEASGKYKVMDTESYQRLLNNQKEPETHSIQIFGIQPDQPQQNISQEEVKVVDPFGTGYLTPSNVQHTIKDDNIMKNQETFVGKNLNGSITPEKANIPFTQEQLKEGTPSTNTAPETFVKPSETDFKHYTETVVPENPLKKLWYDITQLASAEHSIAFSSLIVNAVPIEISDNTLRIGFSSSHTYQMKQLKKQANTAKMVEILRTVTGQELNVSYEILAERKENSLTLHITNEDKQSNNERVHSLQILGGN